MELRRLLWLLMLPAMVLALGPAWPQAVQQTGAITQYHPPGWFYNGFVGDGGAPNSPYLNAVGTFAGTNCPIGVSSQPSPGTPPAQYSALTLCQTNSTTTFKIRSYGGLSDPVVEFDINGHIYTIPGGSGPTTTPRLIATGTSDNALAGITQTILWNSATALAKTENLPLCNSAEFGFEVVVADDHGNAGTYPISVAPNGSDTVMHHLNYVVISDNGTISLMCDGLGNWAQSR